jgi:hypothetical protein
MARLRIPGSRTIPRGGIRADGAYTTDDLMATIGMGRHTLSEARQSGMVKPVQLGTRDIYFGREVMAYLEHLQKQQYGESA